MRISLVRSKSSFAHLPNEEVHWDTFKKSENPGWSPLVYGVEFRDGQKLFLLIPDRFYPEDVLFSDTSQYDIVDPEIPTEWGLSSDEFSRLYNANPLPTNRLIAYPVFTSAPDFVWRLSEGGLTNEERCELERLLEKEH